MGCWELRAREGCDIRCNQTFYQSSSTSGRRPGLRSGAVDNVQGGPSLSQFMVCTYLIIPPSLRLEPKAPP